MLDLDAISAETLLARGKYSTVRGEHEDAKRGLHSLCSQQQSLLNQVLKRSTGDPCECVADLLIEGNRLMEEIERATLRIESLAAQRAELKKLAW